MLRRFLQFARWPHALPCLLLLAFAFRVFWVVLVFGTLGEPPTGDPLWYHRTAQGIAAGQGYVVPGSHQPTAYYSPGYSFFLAFFYFLFGSHVWVAYALNILLTTGMVWLTYRLGARFSTPEVALAAALLMACFPSQVIWAGTVMSEPLFGFLALAALETAFCGRRGRSWLGGALFAALLLVRSQSIVLLPVLLAGLFAPRRRAFREMATFGLVALLLMLPWLFRNQQVFHHPVLTTNSGVNLVMGMVPEADGSYVEEEVLARYVRFPATAGEYEIDQAYQEAGLRLVRQEPMRWVSLIPRKAFVFLRSDLSSLEKSVVPGPALKALFLWSLGKGPYPALPPGLSFAVFFTQFYYLGILALALMGLVSRWREAFLLVLLSLALGLSLTGFHVLYVAPERYHFLLIPFLSLLAASRLCLARQKAE